jgi:plastocyanin
VFVDVGGTVATDVAGAYGFDVTPADGVYRVVVTRGSYPASTSAAVELPPLRRDLNVAMTTERPAAGFDSSPVALVAGDTVTLTSTSTHPLGADRLMAFAWDLDDDGAFDDATGATAATSFATAGAHVVALRVTDDDGDQAVARRTVTVAAAPLPAAPPVTPPVTPPVVVPPAEEPTLPVLPAPAGFVGPAEVQLRPAEGSLRVSRSGRFSLRLRSAHPFALTGSLDVRRAGRSVVGPARLLLPALGRQTLSLRLTADDRRRLRSAGRLVVRVVASVRDPEGGVRRVRATLVLLAPRSR